MGWIVSNARSQLVADLEEAGVSSKNRKLIHSVGHSERTDAVVEPYLSTQWFVKMEELAEKRSVANQNRIKSKLRTRPFRKYILTLDGKHS